MTPSPSSRRGRGDAGTSLRLPFAAASVGAARRQLVASLKAAGVPGEAVSDAALVVSELVTNAVRHGRPTASGHVDVSWRVARGRVRIVVVDQGRGAKLAAGPRTTDRTGGRGLAIVEELCDSWTTDHRGGGLRVTAELRYA